MLYLILQLGQERFALQTQQVIEIVPYVSLKPIARAPEYIAGLFNYRGNLVPVVDLCHITTGNHSRAWLTTRIVVVEYPLDNGEQRRLGLLVEQVNDTRKIQDQQFAAPGVELPETPYLGDIAKLDDGLVQRVEVRDLLPEAVCNLLFQECA